MLKYCQFPFVFSALANGESVISMERETRRGSGSYSHRFIC